MEGYHLSSVHQKTLHAITPTRLCRHFPPGEGYFGYFSNFPEDLPQPPRDLLGCFPNDKCIVA